MPCLRSIVAVALAVTSDLGNFLKAMIRSRTSLVAENLFLRKQLAFYKEHKMQPQRLTDAARYTLVVWSRMFDCKNALVVVKPDNLIGWHRKGIKLFWRWKSRPGRPTLHPEIRALILRMAGENPTWGQMRVAAELYLKLGILVSPRTVRKYWPWEPRDRRGMTKKTIPEYLEEERQKDRDAQLRMEEEVARIQPLNHGHHRTAKQLSWNCHLP